MDYPLNNVPGCSISRSAAERRGETHTLRACMHAWRLMHDAVSGRVRQVGLGNRGWKCWRERASEREREIDGSEKGECGGG